MCGKDHRNKVNSGHPKEPPKSAQNEIKKPFLGGFRHKISGVEYHHASTQVKEDENQNRLSQELQLSTTTQKAVQVVQAKNKYSQTDHEIATQTSSVCSPAAAQRGKIKINHNRDGILIRNSERSENDDFPPLGGGRDKEGKVLIGLSSRYQTADDWNAIRNKHAKTIQIAIRRWLKARNVFKAHSAISTNKRSNSNVVEMASNRTEEDEEEKVVGDEEGDGDKQQIGGKVDAEKEAYQRMIAELESRQKEMLEADILNGESEFSDAEIRRKKAKETAEEALKMAREARERQLERSARNESIVESILMRAGQPKIWKNNSRAKKAFVETPDTNRAKELAGAYLDLKGSEGSPDFEDERVFILQNAVGKLDFVSDSYPEKKELLILVAREAEFVRREVKTENLIGLRKRISAAYLRILKCPEFNPEIARFEQKIPGGIVKRRSKEKTPLFPHSKAEKRNVMSQDDLVEEKITLPSDLPSPPLEFCMSCRRHFPRSAFPLSEGGNRCTNCENLEEEATRRQDLSAFKTIMENVKRGEEKRMNTTSPVFQMQVSDVRYIVQAFWDNQSVLSGSSELKKLCLVRWDKGKEWSPWNCVLLTEEEKEIHENLVDLRKAYGRLLIEKIRQKHTMAMNYFSKLPTMRKYFTKSGCLIRKSEFSIIGESVN